MKKLRNAAERGDAKAQFCFGDTYYYGRKGFCVDYKEAFKWYMKGAQQGYAAAQYAVANCYKFGHGVKKSGKNALQWYGKSAEQEYPKAVRALGDHEMEGDTIDNETAFRLYLYAAELGDPEAQYAVAVCYVDGDVVEQNGPEAYEWLIKSAEGGCVDAEFALDQWHGLFR
jgi:TPR repeat protein